MTSEHTIVWQGKDGNHDVRCDGYVLAQIAEAAVSGFRRYSWGGVEIGGVLFGTREPDGVHIRAFRPAECEHDFGPSFELSDKDVPGFDHLLASATDGSELAGLAPVGWYQSVSRREVALSERSRALFPRFFKDLWQVALVVKRSKTDPLSVGIFHRHASGRVELHSSIQEFTLEQLQTLPPPPPCASPAGSVRPETSSKPHVEPAAAETTEPEPAAAKPSESVGTPVAQPVEQDSVQAQEPVAREAVAIEVAAEEVVFEAPIVDETKTVEAAEPISAPEAMAEAVAPEAPKAEEVPGAMAFPEVPAVPEELTSAAAAPVSPASSDPTEALLELVSAASPPPLAFLGLNGNPFSAAPDPKFFYPSRFHREALAILLHRIQERFGFLALIGEPGTGKSMVVERLTELLRQQSIPVACLLNSRIGVPEFFELLDHDLDLKCPRPSKTAVLIALNEYLFGQLQEGRTAALVVDNAQKLPIPVLEEIELLGNLETRHGRLLQVVFAAQPSFDRLLEAPEVRGLKQRMMVQARLYPLDSAQTAAFIEFRLAQAGLPHQTIFPADVIGAIHNRTRGLPRLINGLCGAVLAQCLEERAHAATVSMIETVSQELALDYRLTASV